MKSRPRPVIWQFSAAQVAAEWALTHRNLTPQSASHSVAHYHRTRFVQIGAMAGPTMTLPAGILRGNGITLSGMGLGSVPFDVLTVAHNEGLPRLLAMVAAGELHIATKQRPLAEVADAWSRPEPSGRRVVLTP